MPVQPKAGAPVKIRPDDASSPTFYDAKKVRTRKSIRVYFQIVMLGIQGELVGLLHRHHARHQRLKTHMSKKAGKARNKPKIKELRSGNKWPGLGIGENSSIVYFTFSIL